MLLLLAVGMSFPVTARAAQDFIVGFDAEFPAIWIYGQW